VITPTASAWWTVPPMSVFGIGNAFVWSPNSATATRNLPTEAASVGSDVLVMDGGRVVEAASADEVFASPRTEYTRSLLAAIPGAGLL
jgi:hypothetical protein